MIKYLVMSETKTATLEHQKETVRVETFSDGVFCIAVTLLSIEIGVAVSNNTTNTGLFHSLLDKWPICVAYVISFVNVLLAWIGHHGVFKNIRNTDNAVMISNGVLLMMVALVPFPTKTLGLFLLTDALKTAVVFYTGYFVLISIAFRILWQTILRNKTLWVHGLTTAQIKTTTRNENIGLICNSIIMLVAFINPWTALGLSFIMWIYWVWIA